MKKKSQLFRSTWNAFVKAKCPRCRLGDAFQGPTYGFKLQEMNEYCPCCKLRFEREPGYFYVAMFVSYAMNVAQIIAISIGSHILGLKLEYENLWTFVYIIFIGVALFSPFNYRYSRMVLLFWLSPGLHYEPEREIFN